MLAGFVHNYEIDRKVSLGYLYPVSNVSLLSYSNGFTVYVLFHIRSTGIFRAQLPSINVLLLSHSS